MQTTCDTLSSNASLTGPGLEGSRPSLGAAAGAVWCFLSAFGQRRAAAEILEIAKSLQATRPEAAAQMRRAVQRSWD